jgi:adenosylcobinamide kinase/adenosylcobinamide-phosphate guanylyltransferase
MSDPLPRVTLVLGGARSGKSRYAESLMNGYSEVVYIATAEALDDEMTARIARHRAGRPSSWRTVEAPLELAAALDRHGRQAHAVLVDCLTLWLSNLLLAERDVQGATRSLLESLSQASGPVILVANEVGLGIVPENKLARLFRDEAGWLNQRVATVADRVVFMAAGLPLILKN